MNKEGSGIMGSKFFLIYYLFIFIPWFWDMLSPFDVRIFFLYHWVHTRLLAMLWSAHAAIHNDRILILQYRYYNTNTNTIHADADTGWWLYRYQYNILMPILVSVWYQYRYMVSVEHYGHVQFWCFRTLYARAQVPCYWVRARARVLPLCRTPPISSQCLLISHSLC